ncbi:hypothetical protein V6Z94_002624 [Aspergillus fumigatus]
MWREKLLFNPSSMQLDCTETINGHRPKNGDLAVPMISVVLISGLLFSVRGKTCPGFPELSKLRQYISIHLVVQAKVHRDLARKTHHHLIVNSQTQLFGFLGQIGRRPAIHRSPSRVKKDPNCTRYQPMR